MGIVELLAKKFGKSDKYVETFLRIASRKYKVYTIPKRTSGHRVIAQPTKELKNYQRAFLDCYTLPIHPCAMAYRKGLSIKDNAEAHKKSRYLLKMDLENFFNSIRPSLFWKVWDSHQNQLPKLSINEKSIIEQLTFWCPSKKKDGKLVLSVGAPSSPMISNFCMHIFDDALTKHCTAQGITYTRYADDLTFSTNIEKVLFHIPKQLREILYEEFGNAIKINHIKTTFSSKAHNRHVTGITLSNDENLSLGRSSKRYIKHLIHQFNIGLLEKNNIPQLQGLLAYTKHIEPIFLQSLEKKYGYELLNKIHKA